MSLYLCSICGYVSFGSAPEQCPVCMSPKEKFEQKDNLFKESKEKSPEGAVKHQPVITVNKDCKVVGGACVDITIKVGEAAHPMEEKHFITFIDCYVDEKWVSRIMLTPNVFAAGTVHLKASGSKFKAVERCNVHGWWESEATI
jgi:superoxide reductase